MVAEGLRDLAELNHVKATLPSLILRNEALVTTQASSELHLSDIAALRAATRN